MDVAFSLADISKAAAPLAAAVEQRRVIALSGEMGAGKTTLVHAVCDLLGVKEAVSSPTFSIINEYRQRNGESVYHLDLYRLRSAEEGVAAGVEDCLHSGAACIIEWPDITPSLFPENTLHCELIVTGPQERMLKIKL